MTTRRERYPENPKLGRATSIARTGIKAFVEQKFKVYHKKLLNTIREKNKLETEAICTSCTNANTIRCFTTEFCYGGRSRCRVHDNRSTETCYRPCPNNICGNIQKSIEDDHRSNAPANSPAWRNADATKWCTDYFEIFKCFLPVDSSYRQAKELLSIDLYAIVFALNNLIEVNGCQEVIEALSDKQTSVNEVIDKLIVLLGSVPIENEENAVNAVRELTQLKSELQTVPSEDATLSLEQLELPDDYDETGKNAEMQSVDDSGAIEFRVEYMICNKDILPQTEYVRQEELDEIEKKSTEITKEEYLKRKGDNIGTRQCGICVNQTNLSIALPCRHCLCLMCMQKSKTCPYDRQNIELVLTYTADKAEVQISRSAGNDEKNDNIMQESAGARPKTAGRGKRLSRLRDDTNIPLIASRRSSSWGPPSRRPNEMHRSGRGKRLSRLRDDTNIPLIASRRSSSWGPPSRSPNKMHRSGIGDTFWDQFTPSSSVRHRKGRENRLFTDDLYTPQMVAPSSYEMHLSGIGDTFWDEFHPSSYVSHRKGRENRLFTDDLYIPQMVSPSPYEMHLSGIGDTFLDEFPPSSYVRHRKGRENRLFTDDLYTPQMVSPSSYEMHLSGIGDTFLDQFTPSSSVRHRKATWSKCIQEGNEYMAIYLIKRGILPINEELQRLVARFGIKSTVLKQICRRIEESMIDSSYNIVDIITCYKSNKPNKIVFVVFPATGRDFKFDNKYQYPSEIHRQSNHEANEIIDLEVYNHLHFDEVEMNTVSQYLRTESPGLMDNHSNLNMTTASHFKSSSYGCENIKERKTCIVFYVSAKGFIPVGEDILPPKIGPFPTDVREGRFVLTGGGRPGSKHKHVKTGCQISSDGSCGTIGGFVEHPNFGLCAMTCAHVLLTVQEFEKLYEKGNLQLMSKGQYCPDRPDSSWASKACYQPENPDRMGTLVDAMACPGDKENCGLDIAFVKVDSSRQPMTGEFPDSKRQKRTCSCLHNKDTFIENQLKYKNGTVFGRKEIPSTNTVVKYGATTTFTTGIVQVHGSSVRPELSEEIYLHHRRKKPSKKANRILKYALHDQINIFSSGQYFSDKGDSGSLVMSICEGNVPVAFGILVGGGKDCKISFATPLSNILEKIGMTSPFSLVQLNNERRFGHLSEKIDKVDETLKEILARLPSKGQGNENE